MDGNVECEDEYTHEQLVKDQIEELHLRLETLTTLVEATMEQMSGLMDMMVQALPTRTAPRTFSENIFSQEC